MVAAGGDLALHKDKDHIEVPAMPQQQAEVGRRGRVKVGAAGNGSFLAPFCRSLPDAHLGKFRPRGKGFLHPLKAIVESCGDKPTEQWMRGTQGACFHNRNGRSGMEDERSGDDDLEGISAILLKAPKIG